MIKRFSSSESCVLITDTERHSLVRICKRIFRQSMANHDSFGFRGIDLFFHSIFGLFGVDEYPIGRVCYVGHYQNFSSSGNTE